MKKPSKPVLVRPADAEGLYGITSRQIKRWAQDGKLSSVKLSGERGPLWVRTAELDALIERNTTKAGDC